MQLAKLTEEKLAKLKVLIDQGFSNGEISRALKVSDETVRKYRGDNNVKKSETNKEADKSSRKQRFRDSRDNRNKKRQRKSEHNIPSVDTTGSEPGINGSTGDTGERINFVGGRDPMAKKEDSEEFEYECENCGHEFNGKPSHCPKCGIELEYD